MFEKIFSGISTISVFGTGPMSENGTNRKFFFPSEIFEKNFPPISPFFFFYKIRN